GEAAHSPWPIANYYPSMDRRTFVQSTAAALAGVALHRPVAAPVVGLELYTVRRELARDVERALADVAAIGYRDVEVVWPLLQHAPAQYRAMLDRAGLRAL